MSILEFIAAVKWPLVVLIVVGLATLLVVKYESLREALKQALDRIESLKVGNVEVTLGAVLRAAQLSDQTFNAQGVEGADVQQLRREAVEEIIRRASAWGWSAARMGTWQREPEPIVRWDGDEPVIQFGVASAAESHSRMLQEWYRRTGA